MDALIVATDVSHAYGKVQALSSVSLRIHRGTSVGFIGPDGVGKSTLLGLFAGAKKIQSGTLTMFGGDAREHSVQRELQQRVAYMPQGLGKNLYPDLSIQENLSFFAKLYELDARESEQRIQRLLEATDLVRFRQRPAGKLSGGMKQKLGLCCALIHEPELLILDEPTTGVDPLSRQQFWSLIDDIRAAQADLCVLVATSYMEEAERFDYVMMMDDGNIIAQGTSEELKSQCGKKDLEQAFIAFLPEAKRENHIVPSTEKRDLSSHEIAIEARGLTRRFGDFTAVDHVDFKIPKGEIYGFLGSNGCGKTTTMKMLTGLLPMTEGESFLFGKKLVAGDVENRRRIGYMSQAFSLYGELTVHQNLVLHANLYGLTQGSMHTRLDWIYDTFDLRDYSQANSSALPLGVKQRLSLAVAVIHEPEVLILDEPTSGVDPVARDNFWALLIELAHRHHVTIFISTHFMNEAARCDRISFMHAGKVVASGTPEALRQDKQAVTLDEAFIVYLQEASHESTQSISKGMLRHVTHGVKAQRKKPALFSWGRMGAYLHREVLELKRDPVRLSVATLGTSFLMLVFGFGITLDVDSLRFAVLDRDNSPESRTYREAYEGSVYFKEQPSLKSHEDMVQHMKDGSVSLALEIPPDFGKRIRQGKQTEIAATIEGALPFRAETIGGYIQAIHGRFMAAQGVQSQSPLTLESRYRYNQSFQSVNAIVPSVMGLLLVFIPAILAALSVVREKEMGSIANLYVTPVSRLEFILGKQLPYVAFSMVSFLMMFLIAVCVFGVAFKGSFVGLVLGALCYVAATTGMGLLISSFTRSQIAALFGTAMLTIMPATQFSGMLRPVATLEGAGYWIGTLYPTTYFIKISVGAFTKGLGLESLLPFIASLACFYPVLLTASVLTLRKQEQ